MRTSWCAAPKASAASSTQAASSRRAAPPAASGSAAAPSSASVASGRPRSSVGSGVARTPAPASTSASSPPRQPTTNSSAPSASGTNSFAPRSAPAAQLRASTAPGSQRAAGLGERDARARLARREPRQPALLLRRASAVHERERRERVPEERDGHGAAAQLLGDQRELEQLEARAALRLGHDEARDADLGEPLPERRHLLPVAVEDRAHLLRRALLRDEAAHRLLQQLLLVREREIHPPSPPKKAVR